MAFSPSDSAPRAGRLFRRVGLPPPAFSGPRRRSPQRAIFLHPSSLLCSATRPQPGRRGSFSRWCWTRPSGEQRSPRRRRAPGRLTRGSRTRRRHDQWCRGGSPPTPAAAHCASAIACNPRPVRRTIGSPCCPASSLPTSWTESHLCAALLWVDLCPTSFRRLDWAVAPRPRSATVKPAPSLWIASCGLAARQRIAATAWKAKLRRTPDQAGEQQHHDGAMVA